MGASVAVPSAARVTIRPMNPPGRVAEIGSTTGSPTVGSREAGITAWTTPSTTLAGMLAPAAGTTVPGAVTYDVLVDPGAARVVASSVAGVDQVVPDRTKTAKAYD